MSDWQMQTLPFGLVGAFVLALNFGCVALCWRSASDFKRAIYAGMLAANTIVFAFGSMIWALKK